METPKEKVKRLSIEWNQLIYNTRLGHRGDRHHFEDSLRDILEEHQKLLATAKDFAESLTDLSVCLRLLREKKEIDLNIAKGKTNA